MLATSWVSVILLGPSYYHSVFFVILVFLTQSLAQSSSSVQNLTIPLDAPQVAYLPSLCEEDGARPCDGTGWVVRRASGQTTISATDQASTGGGILPQISFQFHGSALFLETSNTSNARANITVTTNTTTTAAVFNSGLGSASVLNLSESTVTTFSLVLLSDPNTSSSPNEFILTSLIVTISDDLSTSAVLLPPTSRPPSTPSTSVIPVLTTSTLNTSTTPSTSPAGQTDVPLIVGTTIGLGLGVPVAAAPMLWWWIKKYRRKKVEETAPQSNPERTSAWYGSWN